MPASLFPERVGKVMSLRQGQLDMTTVLNGGV
jgi:hypothetical protein